MKEIGSMICESRREAFPLMFQVLHLPKVYKVLEFFGLETGAFSQLTREYMAKEFNPKTPDLEGVR